MSKSPVAIVLVCYAAVAASAADAADLPPPRYERDMGPQSYWHLRLPEVFNDDQALNLTLAFHTDGRFARGWGVVDEPNRGIVYSAGNRKVTRGVERQVKNPQLLLEENRLSGTVVMRVDGYDATVAVELVHSEGRVSGNWRRIYPARDGDPDGIDLSGSAEGRLSGDRRRLVLDLNGAQRYERMGKYGSRLWGLRLSRSDDGAVVFRGRPVPGLTWTDTHLRGELPVFLRIRHPDQAERPFEIHARYTLDVALPEDDGSGRQQKSEGSHQARYRIPWETTGPVTGHMIDEAVMAARQAIDPAKDWPAWRGPFSNFRGHDSGYTLVRDMRNARLMWKSDPTPPGRAQDKRYFGGNHGRGIGGGGSSPIVYDNRVVQVYLRPSGEAYDKAYVDRIRAAGIPLVMDQWRVAADDIVQAMDLTTGRTLWRTTLPDRGLNYAVGSKSGGNFTPCAGDGRIYVLGSTLRLYALDAADGSLLWESHVGAGHKRWDRAVREASAAMTLTTWNRSNNGSPIYHEGVVIVPNFTREGQGIQRLHGFDAASGERLWTVDDIGSHNATAAIWEHDGASYVICSGYEDLACIDLKSGAEIWRLEDVGNNGRTVVVSGDFLITESRIEKSEEHTVHCFALRPDGATLLWSRSNPAGFNQVKRSPTDGTHVWVWARDRRGGIDVLDLATGELVSSFRGAGNGQYAFMLMADGRYIKEVDGTHSLTQMQMIVADPANPHPSGRVWNPPHHQQTGYAHAQAKPYVDGRLIFRGHSSIAAYDLRAIGELSQPSPGSRQVEARVIAPWLGELPDVQYRWTVDGDLVEGPEASVTVAESTGPFARLVRAELLVTAADGTRMTSRHSVPVFAETWPAAVLPKQAVSGVVVERFPSAKRLEQVAGAAERIDVVPSPASAVPNKDPGGGLRLRGWFKVAQDGVYRISPPIESYGLSIPLGTAHITVDGQVVYHNEGIDRFAAHLVPLSAGWHAFEIRCILGAKSTGADLGLVLMRPESPNWFQAVPTDGWRRQADVATTPEPTVDPEQADQDALMDALDAESLGF